MDAESWESCIERDARPSGEEQPVDCGKLGLVMLYAGQVILSAAYSTCHSYFWKEVV